MTSIRRILFMILMCVSGRSGQIHAQLSFEEYKRKSFEQFELFKTENQNEFESYRTHVNREYEEFMRITWQEYKIESAIDVPLLPKSPKPIMVKTDAMAETMSLPRGKITFAPEPILAPVPLLPKDNSVINSQLSDSQIQELSFTYYGTPCKVSLDKSLMFSLRSVDENSVADAWRQLSSKESVDLVRQCVVFRESMKLSDWGYLRLVEKLSEAVFQSKKNEATLLQIFILAQSGYKIRLGRCNDSLVALVSCNGSIYNYSYLAIDGLKYYITNLDLNSGGINVYNRMFPGERMFSLDIYHQPVLEYNPAATRHFSSDFNSTIDVDLAVNQNLMDYYNDYPLSSNWNIYACI